MSDHAELLVTREERDAVLAARRKFVIQTGFRAFTDADSLLNRPVPVISWNTLTTVYEAGFLAGEKFRSGE